MPTCVLNHAESGMAITIHLRFVKKMSLSDEFLVPVAMIREEHQSGPSATSAANLQAISKQLEVPLPGSKSGTTMVKFTTLAFAPQASLLADAKTELIMPAGARPKASKVNSSNKAPSLITQLFGPNASMQEAQEAREKTGVEPAPKAKAKARAKGTTPGVGGPLHLLS